MSNWLTLKKNRPPSARYLPLEKGNQFKLSEISLFNEPLAENQSSVTESSGIYQSGELCKNVSSFSKKIFNDELF